MSHPQHDELEALLDYNDTAWLKRDYLRERILALIRSDREQAVKTREHDLDHYYSKKLERVDREARIVTGETSDGYHTFNELYDYRRAYNAALFNEWAKNGAFQVHKSWKHSDGEDCFGGGWFIVMAQLPTGQISNHYEAKYWDDFDIPEEPLAAEWDGHTPQEALERLQQLHSEEETK